MTFSPTYQCLPIAEVGETLDLVLGHGHPLEFHAVILVGFDFLHGFIVLVGAFPFVEVQKVFPGRGAEVFD